MTDYTKEFFNVLFRWHRQFKEIKTKRQIMGKLYNMARAKEAKIRSIPKLKGVYGVVK